MKLIVLVVLCVSTIFANPLLDTATVCNSNKCKIADNCRCSTNKSPLSSGDAPQFIVLTFDESIVETSYTNYWQKLLYNRVNPDGNPIRGTFFVPHEYTDYEKVQQLYLHGMEIGVHSVTKNALQSYWREASVDTLYHEFGDQRKIISRFANIPIEDIVGARTPQLQIKGDDTINALIKAEIQYDNSWPTLSTKRLFPYTLDYKSTQDCTVSMDCPTESHPGFWIFPITNIVGVNNVECNSLVTCGVNGTAQEIADWFLDQVKRVRERNRSPIDFRIDTYWFTFTKNSFEGLNLFLDELAKLKDVFLVSQTDVLDWMQNPVAYDKYKTKTLDRDASCNAISCKLQKGNDTRYMKSCVTCPDVYPWLNNPYGEKTAS